MKKLFLIIFTLVLCAGVFAQSYVPKIQANSVISYNYTLNGQDLPLTLTFNNLAGPIAIDWSIDGIGSGNYEMSAKALSSGRGISLLAPEPDQLTKLPDYKTVACISQSAFNDMVKNNEFEFDDLKFTAKKDDSGTIKVNNKALDVYHAVATNGKGEMWILNNPDFPLVCKTKDNAQGVDISITGIK